ncbi:DNA polymerase III subunit beta [Ameyamaea chiangmaiensis NBRC 103196]|uniref:Beta sliding clamp n=1 Tax=Ameyamaea chiangmaiensis TaxID=442969 RepID=A0A850PFH4_9PROT|nr:DNA polymerase III subunit beta [Ameyamaea chiangmaiensis]MBS4073628.1 DNA polymerase III subunit beta [Ameyamaea chiangmaiensis]NVN41200.1 DNA polymerase III subunit beta [Ameyamaea chiangmaiensis]GBQ69014.1 DNA polymerase III subunit beta [Ameyamaea chiangmaiensis NBRC 103196]
MKLKADRAILIKALAHIQSVAEKRNTIPILANVLLTVKNGHLTLTATDMEIAVVETVAATGVRDGSATAPAAVLYEIVRKLPDGADVELDHPGGDSPLALRAGRYATNLNVLPVDDFPSMVAGDLPCRFRIPAATLRGLIDRTRFAISTEETRYYLNGIYLHATEGDTGPTLRAVATDGHRLARVETELPDGAAGMPGVIVPRKTVAELRKLLDEGAPDVDVALSDTRIQFTAGGVMLTSKLIDGTFPEYERVIPRNNDRILRVGKRDFADAVARVAAISQERNRPVKMALAHNLLTLSASSPDQGIASEELDENRVSYDAAPIEIGFQARYLNDITDQIDKDVEFAFADSAAPTVVRDVDSPSALYVLMPMRV